MNALSPILQACIVALCPIVTLFPISVGEPFLPVAEKPYEETCMIVPS